MASLLSWVALLVGLGVAAYTWKLHQELNIATRRLDRYNRALFDANDEIRRLREDLAETSSRWHVELLKRTGAVSFAPEMTVREALLLHPQADQVLAGFHLGGCSSCAVEPDATLAQTCAQSGVDINQLLQNLNYLVGNARRNGDAPQPVKLPNVELEF